MAKTLRIVKNAGQEGNWSHLLLPNLGEYEISAFYLDIDNGMFQIKEFNGGSREKHVWSDIELLDNSMGAGVVYNPSSIPDLVNWLVVHKYTPYFYVFGSGGTTVIQAGTGISVTGTGTIADPFIITNTGGSGGGYTSLQQMYDADPANTQLTDGVNTLIVDPANVYVSSDLVTGGIEPVVGISDVSGAEALNELTPVGGDVVGQNRVKDSAGHSFISRGDGSTRMKSNDFEVETRADSLTEDRTHQKPNGDGTYGLSVTVDGVDYPFGTDGKTADIPSGGGGGVSNPLTDNLDGGGFRISNLDRLTTANLYIGADQQTGVNSGDDAPNSTSDSYADSKIASAITNGDTTHAPNGDVVFDALATKQNTLTNSAGLAAALSDETGTGLAVFNNSPTLITPNLGTPSAVVLTNGTGLPQSGVTNLTTDLALKQAISDMVNYERTINKSTSPSTVVTSTITETITLSVLIPAGTYAVNDFMNISAPLTKTGIAGTCLAKMYVNTINSLVAASQIGQINLTGSNISAGFARSCAFQSGNILDVYPPTQNAAFDEAGASALARVPVSLNPANDFYVIVTLTNTSAADSSKTANHKITKL